MKTKKIEKTFWVSKVGMDVLTKSDTGVPSIYAYKDGLHDNKITISFDVPEKKVTISESEFDAAFNVWGGSGMDGFKKAVKQKLFGERND